MAAPAKTFLLGCFTGAILGPVVIAVLGLGVIFAFRDQFADFAAAQQAARLAPPKLGMGLEADYTLAFHGGNGEARRLEEYRGRTVLLYFWHPGCVACLAGLPALKQLGTAIADVDAVILPVAIGDEEEIEPVRQTYGLEFPPYVLDGTRPAVFQAKNITPAAFLVAPDGAVVFQHAGAAQWDAEALTALIRAVAKKKEDGATEARPPAALTPPHAPA